LTAEQLITKVVKGYPKREWQKTRERNEALDCRVYARAAAISVGIDRWSESRWEQLAERSGASITMEPVKKVEVAESLTGAAAKVAARQRVVRSSFL
jgi:phage terminase large subunit GpA-like protein